MRFRHLAVALVLVLALVSAGVAQTSKGILSGVIRDTTGAAIPGATVTVTNQDTGETRTVTSEATGAYRVDAISPGSYRVHVEMNGFQKFDARDVPVQPSVVNSFDPILQVGSVDQTVEVTADSAQLNTDNGSLASTISQVELTKVPIFSLNPIELATTLPGVQVVRNSGFSNGMDIQVSGARPRANNFLIDGQEINDTSIAGQAFQPQIPFIFQNTVVYTHNPPAEFGRASGGVVNLITKGGTNQFHGQVWELYTGSGLNALDGANRGAFFGGTKTRFNQHQFGFVVGGPILKDKLFAFGGAQWSRFYGKEETATFIYPDANGVALLKQIAAGGGTTGTQATSLLAYLHNGDYLTTYGPGPNGGARFSLGAACPATSPGCSVTMGAFRRPRPNQINPNTQWTYRIDFTPRTSDSLFFRYLHDRGSLTPDLFANPNADIGFDTFQGGPSEVGQGGWTHVFTPHLLNELRAAETRIDFQFAPTAETKANPLFTAPQLAFGTAATAMSNVGYNINFPQGRREYLYQFQDTVSYTIGRHTMRLGADVGRQLNVVIVPQNTNGRVSFVSGGTGNSPLGNYLLNQTGGSGGSVTRSFGPTRFDPHVWRIGIFGQDDIKLSPEFTLNVGMRYDYFTPLDNALPYPAVDPNNLYGPITNHYTVKPDRNNFAPRVGFAFAPQAGVLGRGKTVVRGGFGVFYDSGFTNIAYNSATTAPNSFSNTLQAAGNGVPNATTGAIASIVPQLSNLSSVQSVVNNMRTPYTYEYNLGVEHALPWQMIGSAMYVGSRGLKLFANQQYNYLDPATGGTQRLNTSRGPINVRGNYADSNYNGLETSIERRFTRGLFLRGTYTYSKLLDNGSEVFTADTETTSYTADLSPGGRRQDWSNSAYDHRHFASIVYAWSPRGFHSDSRGTDVILSIFTRGWTVSGIEQFQTGTYGSFNMGGFLDTNGDGSAANDRPILGNPKAPLTTAGVDGYFLKNVFGVSGGVPGTYYDVAEANNNGNAVVVNPSDVHFLIQHGQQYLHQEVARNSFQNPGAQFHNIALEKSFFLPTHFLESGRITLRGEVQNLPNHNNTGFLNIAVPNIGTDTYMNRLNARDTLGRQLKLWAKFEF